MTKNDSRPENVEVDVDHDLQEDSTDEDQESGDGSGIASRIVIGYAKEMGWEEIALITQKWPQLIGKSAAKATKEILAYIAENKPVPPEVEAEAEKAFQDNPEQATLLLGPLLARNYTIGLAAKDEKDFFLSRYLIHLNAIYACIDKRETSVVLRGFIHDPDCVCYWRRSSVSGEAFKRNGDYLETGYGLDVYILDPRIWDEVDEPISADDAVADFNAWIRERSDRQLPDEFSNYRENEFVSHISQIFEMKIVVYKLDPEEEEKKTAKFQTISDVFPLNIRSDPTRYECSIPIGAPGIPVMIDSLLQAIRTQSEPLAQLQKTIEQTRPLLKRLRNSQS